MMAFMQYAMQIVFAFLMLSIMFIILPRAAVSADRIADVLEHRAHRSATRRTPSASPSRSSGTVEFRNVCFRYPGAEEDVLHDITFTARPGQTTAFIGTTGSGKSTIVNLIPRFYDVTDGAILVDGVDVREVTQHDLRDKIGYVPQKSNALLRHDRKQPALRRSRTPARRSSANAADIAQATEFIYSTPEGLGDGDLPGRHERLRRAEAAPFDRPRPGEEGARSTSSTTASRRWTSRPTRPCAGRSRRKPARAPC